MLFDWNTIAAPAALLNVQLSAPRTLTGEGLWVCLVSSGRCTVPFLRLTIILSEFLCLDLVL